MQRIATALMVLALATSFAQEAGPGPRSGQSLVYDPALRKTVLAGGYMPPHDTTSSALWAWDGRSWELLNGSDTGPAKTIVGGAAIDTRRRRLVSFGGSNSTRGTLGDTGSGTVSAGRRSQTPPSDAAITTSWCTTPDDR